MGRLEQYQEKRKNTSVTGVGTSSIGRKIFTDTSERFTILMRGSAVPTVNIELMQNITLHVTC